MDIAALSMASANIQVREQASIAVMDNVMDVSKQQNSKMLEMMNQAPAAPHPTTGNMFDVSV